MAAAEPPTPASTQPCSPTTPRSTTTTTTTATSDPEKQDFPARSYTDRSVTVVDNDSIIDPESLEKRPIDRSASHYLKKLSISPTLSRVSESWKKKPCSGDEEERHFGRIDDHPMGYPRLAAFLDSDENFLLCRRYGFLHTRVLLYRQDELQQLENGLLEMDAEDEESDPRALKSRKRDNRRQGAPRKALIQQIDEKLKQYDDILLRTRNMACLQKATERNYNSLFNWIYSSAPLCGPEAEFIKHKEDFVALADAKEGGWFDGVIEDILSLIPCRLTRLMFSSPAQRVSTDNSLVHLYSKKRIDTFVRLIITILATVLLMAPVVVLFAAEESGTIKIIVILLFTLFFSIALSVFTKAKRHEVFAATAA